MSTMMHPLGKRFLMRKSSNTENLPPPCSSSKKADALVSAREASRRRRARVVSGSMPLKVKKIVQNAQRRASKAAQLACKPANPVVASQRVQLVAPSEPLEIVQETHEATQPAAQATTTPAPVSQPQLAPEMMHFPRYLHRPPSEVWPMPIRRENVDACDSGLVDADLKYIQRGLETAGQSMWHLVKNAQIDSTSMGHRASLPDEVNVIIADHAKMQSASLLPPSHPTHVLAVWDLPLAAAVDRKAGINPQTGRRKVSLIAAHNLVLATHCAKWFPLLPSSNVTETRVAVNAGGAPGTMINLPVVPLAVPHPPSFLYLLQTMYTHKVSWLLDQLVPVPKPTIVFPTPENPHPRNPHYILETGRRLAARYTSHAIIAMLGTVIGLWQNAIYLGVSDSRLWTGIDWSWDMLLTGLALSLGRPDLVPRPQPRVQWPAPASAVKVKCERAQG